MPSAAPVHSIVGSASGESCLTAALERHPAQIPVLLGGCGSGRTTMLRALQQRLGEQVCQYVDLERTATTPERFYDALVATSPFSAPRPPQEPDSPRHAFDLTLAFIATAHTAGGAPATFLFDEILELRTFENFPGLRHAVEELLRLLASSGNRFALTCRYVSRASRVLHAAGRPFVCVEPAPLTPGDIRALLDALAAGAAGSACAPLHDNELEEFSRVVRILSGGHPASAAAICETMTALRARGGGDPISALSAALAPDGRLAERCLRSYEVRLHRARGYGALKAILDILSDAEPLNLTEIARRLRRTPGSTKDYLTWLEDVDLIAADCRRYRFRDTLLRLWVRLYCHPSPPTDEVLAREIQQFALERLSTSARDAARTPGRPGGPVASNQGGHTPEPEETE